MQATQATSIHGTLLEGDPSQLDHREAASRCYQDTTVTCSNSFTDSVCCTYRQHSTVAHAVHVLDILDTHPNEDTPAMHGCCLRRQRRCNRQLGDPAWQG